MVWNILAWIKKNLIISILVSMSLGVLIGANINMSFLSVTILPLTFVLVYPMMVTLNLGSIFGKMNVKLQLVTQLINFIIYPLVAFGLGLLFFREDPYLRLGLLMIGLLPTSGMTISWTVMAKGNVNSAIKMVVFGLLLGAFLSPLYITFFLGEAVNVPMMKIFTQIIVVVLLPLIAAYITQIVLKKKYGTEKFNRKIKPKFPLVSILGVVLIIFVAMSLKADKLVQNPTILIDILVPLILMYISFGFISLAVAKLFFNREDGIALSNGTLVRSLSVALAISLSAFQSFEIILLISVAYTLQVQLAAWNVRLAEKIYK